MSILFEQVGFSYEMGDEKKQAVHQICMCFERGKTYAIVGDTGSGKSTLVQLIKGLLQPSEGEIIFRDKDSGRKNKPRVAQKEIGMVFQYSDHQLFEETVEQDLCFGPINYGYSLQEARVLAREALKTVGLSEDILGRAPFSLSGGEKRRVALAGILAFHPDVLVLDEPTVGLDFESKGLFFQTVLSLKQKGVTIIWVTHHLEEIAQYIEVVIKMQAGKMVYAGDVRDFLSAVQRAGGGPLPFVQKVQYTLEEMGNVNGKKICIRAEELFEMLEEMKER